MKAMKMVLDLMSMESLIPSQSPSYCS